MPPLGLSNKATEPGRYYVYSEKASLMFMKGDEADNVFSAATSPDMFTRAPFEPELSTITLWPEVEKIFGHGYEVSSSS